MDVRQAVEESKAGKVEYRTDRTAIVHLVIGKTSFDERALLENYAAVIDELIRAKPSAAKGRYLRVDHAGVDHGARASRSTRPARATSLEEAARRQPRSRSRAPTRDPRAEARAGGARAARCVRARLSGSPGQRGPA